MVGVVSCGSGLVVCVAYRKLGPILLQKGGEQFAVTGD
jgi:hypothetical protein